MQDQAATLALLHREKAAGPWYDDWLELSRFAPVLGRWTTLSNYFNEVMPGDYTSAAEADEFHGDYLVERCPTESYSGEVSEPPAAPALGGEQPISMFPRQVRAAAGSIRPGRWPRCSAVWEGRFRRWKATIS